MSKKRTIVIEVSYSRKFTTERYAAYSCPEEALNAVLSEINLGRGNIVVHEAKAYAPYGAAKAAGALRSQLSSLLDEETTTAAEGSGMQSRAQHGSDRRVSYRERS